MIELLWTNVWRTEPLPLVAGWCSQKLISAVLKTTLIARLNLSEIWARLPTVCSVFTSAHAAQCTWMWCAFYGILVWLIIAEVMLKCTSRQIISVFKRQCSRVDVALPFMPLKLYNCVKVRLVLTYKTVTWWRRHMRKHTECRCFSCFYWKNAVQYMSKAHGGVTPY